MDRLKLKCLTVLETLRVLLFAKILPLSYNHSFNFLNIKY